MASVIGYRLPTLLCGTIMTGLYIFCLPACLVTFIPLLVLMFQEEKVARPLEPEAWRQYDLCYILLSNQNFRADVVVPQIHVLFSVPPSFVPSLYAVATFFMNQIPPRVPSIICQVQLIGSIGDRYLLLIFRSCEII